MNLRIAAALLLLAIATGRAGAAEIRSYDSGDPDISVIGLEGQMTVDDGETFAKLVGTIRDRAVVVLNSPGGSIFAALQIGQLIQLKHYTTFVPHGVICTSACAITWLAGRPRVMQPGSRIGFHSAFMSDTGEVTGVGNALIGAFLSKLGLGFEAIVYVEKASPREITWLTEADARDIGLDVQILPLEPNKSGPAPRTANHDRHAVPAPRPLVPALVMPRETPQPASSLEDRAQQFAGDYFSHWSEANGEALGYFSDAYAAKVLYYNTQVERAALLAEKRSYTAKLFLNYSKLSRVGLSHSCHPAFDM